MVLELAAMADDEEDPLDAYMKEIQHEVQKRKQADVVQKPKAENDARKKPKLDEETLSQPIAADNLGCVTGGSTCVFVVSSMMKCICMHPWFFTVAW